MSGKTEPGEPGGRDTHSGTCATTTKDTDNVRGVEATETDEGDTLTPLGRPISRASVLQRMTSRASRRADANESTQLELLLRSQTRESGRVAHSSIRDGDGEKDVGAEPCSGAGTHTGAGVLETTAVVDLGNGPEEVCVIEWVDGDPEYPFNWSSPRKWIIVVCVCYLTALTAISATSVGVMAEWGTVWFGTDNEGFTMGLFMYLLAIAWTPLVLAPMSEIFGRSGIYHVSGILNALLFLPQALSHSYRGYLVTRWFQGMTASVGNSMVGGTIADLFGANNRGTAMNVFSLSIFLGQSLGGAVFGWVGQALGIQWCYGIMAMIGGSSILFNFLVLKETRADVLLARKAARLTKETGRKHIAPGQVNRKRWTDMLRGSAIRPLQYLITEPIVTAISLWIGFAWGCIFLGISSTLLVFGQYGWSSGLTGTSEITLLVGALFGFASNMHMERVYRRAAAASPTGRAAPEVRLYWAATGGLLFPLCLFVYAWTGRREIHWIVPAIFLSASNWGVYVMYSSVFNYLADAYEIYSSSAQASHSFVRNVLSAVFPLFSHKMYNNMGYSQASTTVAAIGLVLAAAPVLLIIYGPRLRAKSKVASAIWAAESKAQGAI